MCCRSRDTLLQPCSTHAWQYSTVGASAASTLTGCAALPCTSPDSSLQQRHICQHVVLDYWCRHCCCHTLLQLHVAHVLGVVWHGFAMAWLGVVLLPLRLVSLAWVALLLTGLWDLD